MRAKARSPRTSTTAHKPRPTGMIRIVIADDHTLFRQGLRQLLEVESDFQVVGEASNGIEAVDAVRELRPHCLLLDLAMPEQGGLDALHQIAALEDGACRVVLLTAEIERTQLVLALRLGARGVVMKHSACEMLCKCIRAVVAGEYWVGRETVSDLLASLSTMSESERSQFRQGQGPFGLTGRELQVVQCVVKGGTNREIAQDLGLSGDTVKHHLSNIFDKLGVDNRLELALFAVNHRLIDETGAAPKADPSGLTSGME